MSLVCCCSSGQNTLEGNKMFEFKSHCPRFFCKDGTYLSVQASNTHYSMPRDNEGPYTHVEVGFPSIDPPESWAEYADGEYPNDVYGYVPLELVNEFIELHGGIDFLKTFAEIQKRLADNIKRIPEDA